MPYDGNGNYTLPPVYKATPGTEIITTQHNTPLEDIQAALNAVLLRNGSAPITGNWNMGTNRITFLADGVANADAANVGQLKALLNNTALTGVTTVPPVTDWTAYQPVGAKDADARYAILNQNNAGSLSITGSFTAQQADLRYLSLTEGTVTGQVLFSGNVTHSGNETFNGTITVPDVSDFTSNQALSAKAAEGRYVKSIPVSPNKRITDIWENANGRLVFGDGTAAPVVALLSDLPISDTTKKIQFFTADAVYSSANPYRINFPTSFKPGTTPIVLIANTGELGTAKLWISNVIPSDGTNLLIDNEGFSVGGYVIGAGIEKVAESTNIIPVIAIGEL